MADRRLVPGRWRMDGARPNLSSCTGSCNQGRGACDCVLDAPEPDFRWKLSPDYAPHVDLHRVTLTELDLELPHDADRVIAPPPSPRRPADPMRRRRLTLAGATAAAAFFCFGVLMLCMATGAHSETATVLVGRAPGQTCAASSAPTRCTHRH